MNSLNMTPEQARAFIRKVMGPPSRTLEGKEKDNILLLLKVIEPFKQTNNQHSWTDYYMLGDKEYHISYIDDDVIVELIEEE